MEDIYEKILKFLYDRRDNLGHISVKHIFLENDTPISERHILQVMNSLKGSNFIETDNSKYEGLLMKMAGKPQQTIEQVTISAKITLLGIKHYKATYLPPQNLNVQGNLAMGNTNSSINQSSLEGERNASKQQNIVHNERITNKNPSKSRWKYIIAFITAIAALVIALLKAFHKK